MKKVKMITHDQSSELRRLLESCSVEGEVIKGYTQHEAACRIDELEDWERDHKFEALFRKHDGVPT